MGTITFYYSASFGKGDGSDALECEIDATEEEVKAYKRALVLGDNLQSVPELKNLYDRANKEIIQKEKAALKDIGEELVGDYSLSIWISDEQPDDKDIDSCLKDVLSEGNVALAERIVAEWEEEYAGNIKEMAYKIATEVGCEEYCKAHPKDKKPKKRVWNGYRFKINGKKEKRWKLSQVEIEASFLCFLFSVEGFEDDYEPEELERVMKIHKESLERARAILAKNKEKQEKQEE